MVKYLDIKRPAHRHKNTANHAKKLVKDTSDKLALIIFSLLIIIIFSGIYIKFYQSINKPSSDAQTNEAQSDTNQQTKKGPIVDIYNSGAGGSEVTKAINELEMGGVTTTNLGDSKLNYDKTYIWYQQGYKDTADKIAQLLVGRTAVVSSTVVKGGFDVLIYMGVK